ncbi:MAG: lipid IV(A) 3-deoxy-D-manno-octulosonic acid transferase [Coxiellaceae bacterium]|nr:lipid IV(A) 3-deoxy-D-manno-octulosonic acid transferase [Coxiellaceae bacterium]
MRKIYSLLLYVAVPFIMLRLLLRSRNLPAYRYRWGERFARYDFPPVKQSIWLHAVSVGEFMAALPMIKQLRKRYPQMTLVVTTTTPTGSEQVLKHFGKDVVHIYTPYDLPSVVNRFLSHMNPAMAIIMETEWWPNLLHYIKKRNIPLMLANARLSQRSADGYARIGGLANQMLSCFSVVAAQSEADGQRFVGLGLPKKNLNVAGNIKFDITVPDELLQKGQQLRQSWGGDSRKVLAVASTHEGEEEHVLAMFRELKQQGYNDLLLVLVPRHTDRFDRVFKMCKDAGFNTKRRSLDDAVTEDTDIFLGDTLGEMKLFLSASDMAFVAGSIGTTGGHNLIEPAILGIPVMTGHVLHNFIAVRDMLKQADAVLISHNHEERVAQCKQLLDDAELCHQMGQRGQQVILSNQGALERHLQQIDSLIKKV